MLKAFFNIGFVQPNVPSYLTGQKKAEYIAKRKFYNLTADYNYFSYVLNGKKTVKNKNAEEYYTRNGANGALFNEKGVMDETDIKALKEDLKNTKSIIWHGVISFDDETSKGFEEQEAAIHFLKHTIGVLFRETGLKKDNIKLYATLHKDTDHRHIHFAFYEKEPKRRDKNGNLCYTKRGYFSKEALDNFLVSANMHLSEYSEDYYSSRDRVLNRLKEIRKEFVKTKSREQDLNTAVTNLARKLPKKGRLQYNSSNMNLYRKEIDRVVDLMIMKDKVARENNIETLKVFSKLKDEVNQLIQDNKLGLINNFYLKDYMNGKHSIDDIMDGKYKNIEYVSKNNNYVENLYKDYRARLGNIVLGMCKELKREDYFKSKNKKVCEKKIEARKYRIKRDNLIYLTISWLAKSDKKAQANFLKTVEEIKMEQEYKAYYGENV